MAVTVLTNLSASAPALSGTAGALIAVLDFCLVTTLGWTKPYSGANLAAYRQPAGSNQMYLRVNDTGATGARIVGYETMSGISVGTGDFPTDAQQSGGLHVFKSNSGDSTARPWFFASNGKGFILVIGRSGTTPASFGNACVAYAFGDFKSYKSGDVYNTHIVADNSASTGSNFYSVSSSFNSATSGHFMARAHTQIGTSVNYAMTTDYAGAGAPGSFGSGSVPYPSPIDGGINISRTFIGESAGRRGSFPGVWSWMHSVTALNSGDTFNGAGDLAGKTFTYFALGSNAGSVVVETSDTWES